MQDISLMWVYRGTSIKMRACPVQCGMVGKYVVYVYVCLCVCVYIYIYTDTHIHTHIYVYVYVICVYVYICAYVYIYYYYYLTFKLLLCNSFAGIFSVRFSLDDIFQF